ncbi:Rieske 2Fe-2S domain-containing protein [Mycobacterium sp. SMC-2]|uniref:aromatic ring-hydroxylating oxygenase subunit alpha n=1 Tax=Mycobacterium sp. SMC-2 TaxID=2857058 RepID=UPI0021B46011|nr:Rieske 2Fe-2S domain-containing protein [Mycobacterium sp. SMC-2]UXA05398.1 Rieske 2Fe-2S domain-containing protein [Mycobacterium sp. SMC-2]
MTVDARVRSNRDATVANDTLTNGISIDDLVRIEAREVSARVVSDPAIFALEMERIFDRVWVFVAHDSEIPGSGDFVVRYMGLDSVIVSRDPDGDPHVLLNVCAHRGARVCSAERGTRTTFECPYHGWVYKNTGELRGMRAQRMIFGDGLDKGPLGLRRARVESFHGLIFATWNIDGPSLREYLGDMAFYYELMLGLTDGGFKVAGPPQRWIVPANWKLASENFAVDNTHIFSVHKFVSELGLMPMMDPIGLQFLTLVSDPRHGHAFMSGFTALALLGAGEMSEHETIDRIGESVGIPPKALPQVHQRLRTELQRRAFQTMMPSVGALFPNFAFLNLNLPTERGQSEGVIPHLLSIRVYQPRSVDEMEIWSWGLVHKDADAELKAAGARAALRTFGPGGTFEQDDAEVWSLVQASFRGSQGRRHVNRYLVTVPQIESDLPGVLRLGGAADDTLLEYYAQWRELMAVDA